ncbi:MAG: hypothetical protein HZA31_11285 [Opitutae bacterium]|nr:hypothetical protein [Opitutae bacterium]
MHEQAGQLGIGPVLKAYAAAPNAQGVLLVPAAAVLSHWIGAGRMTCLSLNFALFVLAQAAVVWAVHRRSRSVPGALFAGGLMLAAGFTFMDAGGVLDFRLDFAASCLYAVLLSAVVGTDFLAQRWGLWPVVGSAVLFAATRFIGTVYIVGIGLVEGGGYAWLAWRERGQNTSAAIARRHRCRYGVWAGIAFGVAMGPLLWYHRHAIFDYYGIGHVLGPERWVREQEQGIAGIASVLAYYPRSVGFDHLGGAFWQLAALGLGALGALRLTARGQAGGASDKEARLPVTSWLTLAAFGAVPGLVLTLNAVKSPVVGSVLVAPVVFILALWFAQLARDRVQSALVLLVAAVVLGGGWLAFAVRASARETHAFHPGYSQAINALYGEIVRQADVRGLARPRLAFLTVDDALLSSALNVWVYENTGRLFEARSVLGGTIMEATPAQIMAGLDTADMVILPDRPLPGSYPFHVSVRQNFDAITAYCRRTMVPVSQVTLPRCTLTLCVKRPAAESVQSTEGPPPSGSGVVSR